MPAPPSMADLERTRRIAHIALAAAAAALLAAGALLVRGRPGPRHDHLTVERLDVVEPDGQLVLSLGNSRRLPKPLIDGRTIETERSAPGLVFFDGHGWEVGGLVYQTGGPGGPASGAAQLSFDQVRNDQVVVLRYQEDGESRSAGLHVLDRAREPDLVQLLALEERLSRASPAERAAAEKELAHVAAERVFVGSSDETAAVRLSDRQGNERIRLLVDRAGDARIELLDAAGAVVERIPRE